MTEQITISLSPENQAALVYLDVAESVEEIINQALRDYLFLRRFRDIRARMGKGIEKLGVRSDDDVFALAS